MTGRSETSGSSLWLVPPEDSELYKTIHSLILTSIPSLYPIAIPPRFAPHISLTVDTISPDAELSQPQKWLDRLKLGDLTKLKISIEKVNVGDIFFQKLVMLCERTPELLELAAHCRGVATGDFDEASAWVEKTYRPHCSLLYSDLPRDEIESKLNEVNKTIQEAKQANPAAKTAKGGSIWLVSTFKDLDEWVPEARRDLSDFEWSWDT